VALKPEHEAPFGRSQYAIEVAYRVAPNPRIEARCCPEGTRDECCGENKREQ
jgi:hypothetical protein